MYTLKLEAKEVQLIQAVLQAASLNMEQSNMRTILWVSMQNQLKLQMPEATPEPGEPKED